MKYYQVKEQYDNKVIDNDYNILVGKELLTEKEIKKLEEKYLQRYPKRINFYDMFDIVEISKKQTYFFCGVRFQM